MPSNTRANQILQKPIPPQGQHLAVCYLIVDLGTQFKSFKGGPPKETPEHYFGWEFCNPKLRAVFNKDAGEQPMAIFHRYSYYLGPKANFGKMINSWFGKEISELNYEILQKFKGRSAMIQVIHGPDKSKVDAKTRKPIMYANIANSGTAIFKRPDDISAPREMFNEFICFSLDAFNWETFNKLPKFLQDIIMLAKEWPSILQEFGPNPLDAGTIEEEQSAEPIEHFEEDEPF